ncbi:hypothetical protein N9X53_07490 [Mariniblastus sp.]|nr:hypothetical protein [Mariniblastus sp.]
MTSLATIGTLIEVTPWDELQHWSDAGTAWQFIDDRSPFRFRVAGKLFDDGFFFGLHGPVESGPNRYLELICNILLRLDNSDWNTSIECGAAIKVGPTIARRASEYVPASHNDVPFYLHPEGTVVDGFPRVSRHGGIRVFDGEQR